MPQRIAILGASGIGKFHAREFKSIGCRVVSILGTSEQSSIETAKMLENSFGIKAKPYSNLDEMLKKEKIDAVSICTPLKTHFDLAKRCLELGVHVLCEKPFTEEISQAKELFEIAHKKDKILTVNTQWPFVLTQIKYDPKINSFEMDMEPGMIGKEGLEDHLPHTNSMLIKLCGIGKMKNLKFIEKKEEKIIVSFDYVVRDKVTKVKYTFNYKKERPRKVSFKINDSRFRRVVGEDYSQKLIKDDRGEILIEDPLKSSIKCFIEAIGNKGKLLSTEEEILANMEIQEGIIKSYNKEIA